MIEVKRDKAVLMAVLIVVSIGLYINTLSAGFVSDDSFQVLKNVWITDFGYLGDVFLSSSWSFLAEDVGNNYYRPFMHLYYMFAYKLSGLDPWGYHAINIALHTLNSVVLFFLTCKVAQGGGAGREGSEERDLLILFAGFFAALLFAANPINTEAVAWVASVTELSVALFVFLSLWLYINKRYYISALFFLCALFSKETAVVLPVLLVAFDLVIKREKVFPVKRWALRYWPYAVAALVYALLRLNAMGSAVPFKSDVKMLSGFEYILNIMPLFVQYLKSLAVPVNLTFYSPVRIEYVRSFFELRSILYTLLFLVILYQLVRLYRRERAVCFAIIWIIAPLIPVFYLGWVRGEPTYADRYLYLSSAGFSIALALVAMRIASSASLTGALNRALVPLSIILLSIAILYGVGTLRRNVVWHSALNLWEDTAAKAPHIIDVRVSYANQLSKAGRLSESHVEYSFVVKNATLKSDLSEAHNGLGIIYAKKGMVDSAINEFILALRLIPDFDAARINLQKASRLKKAGGRR